jgi:hypothetical protein
MSNGDDNKTGGQPATPPDTVPLTRTMVTPSASQLTSRLMPIHF